MGNETLVIVGGGLAAARAIEAIRDGGHTGHVVLVSDDPHLPYDRPPLSKVNMDDVGRTLENQGIATCEASFTEVLHALDTKAHALSGG